MQQQVADPSPWMVGTLGAVGGPGFVALPVGVDGTAALRRAWGAGLPLDTGVTPSHLLQTRAASFVTPQRLNSAVTPAASGGMSTMH